MDSLSPFDFFKLECSNEDAMIKTEAMQKVAIVASLLPPDKVRNELIPFLLSKINEFDQILLELCSKIRHFVPYIGGIDQLHVMIPLIEQLFSVEETTVRNCACNSVNKILAQLNCGQHPMVVNHFIEMAKRILSIEDGEAFYGKVSLAQIMVELFRVADLDKAALMEILGKLGTHFFLHSLFFLIHTFFSC